MLVLWEINWPLQLFALLFSSLDITNYQVNERLLREKFEIEVYDEWLWNKKKTHTKKVFEKPSPSNWMCPIFGIYWIHISRNNSIESILLNRMLSQIFVIIDIFILSSYDLGFPLRPAHTSMCRIAQHLHFKYIPRIINKFTWRNQFFIK